MYDLRDPGQTHGEAAPRAATFHRAMAHGAASAKASVPDAPVGHGKRHGEALTFRGGSQLDPSGWTIPRPGEGIFADLTASRGCRDI